MFLCIFYFYLLSLGSPQRTSSGLYEDLTHTVTEAEEPRSAVGKLESQEGRWCEFQPKSGSKGRAGLVPKLTDRQRERIFCYLEFCCIQASSGSGKAHPSLLSLLV